MVLFDATLDVLLDVFADVRVAITELDDVAAGRWCLPPTWVELLVLADLDPATTGVAGVRVAAAEAEQAVVIPLALPPGPAMVAGVDVLEHRAAVVLITEPLPVLVVPRS